jgi:hypothetical protein
MKVLPKTQHTRNKRIARSVTQRRDTRLGVPTGERNERDEDQLGDRYTRLVLTPEWRQSVRDAMKARGWKPSDLAEALRKHLGLENLHRATITKMLNESAHSTKYVLPTCEVLNISPPSVAIKDALEESYLEDMRTLRELDRDEADRLIGEVRKSATRAVRQSGQAGKKR